MPRAINGWKICSKCDEREPVIEFSKDRTTADGLQYQCKACQKAYRKANKARNRQEGPCIVGYKDCPKCKERKHVSKFYRSGSNFDGLQGWCKACCRAYRKVHYATHGGKMRELHRVYNATERGKRANLRGSRKHRAHRFEAGGSHTTEEFIELCEALGFRCQGHGEILLLDKLTEDHVIPLSRGGSDSIDNIQPLCRSCNASKGSKTQEEWENTWSTGLLQKPEGADSG